MPPPILAPDLILHNANVLAMDDAHPVATSVAIKDGRFVAIGGSDDLKPLAAAHTRLENLGGATIVPGLVDAHNHLLATGLMLGQLQLYDCRSIADLQRRLAERVRATPPGS